MTNSLLKRIGFAAVAFLFTTLLVGRTNIAHAILDPGGGGATPTPLTGGLEGNLQVTCNGLMNNDLISDGGFIESLCQLPGQGDRPVIDVIIEKTADVVIFLSVVMFSIMIALAGLQISASGGSPEGIKAGKRRITLAVSSMALIWSANFILRLIGVIGDRKTFFGVDVEDGFNFQKVNVLLPNILEHIQYLAGAAAIGFVIVGGIRLMTSAGNPQAIQGAKKTITYALIGLAVVAGTILIRSTITLIITGSVNPNP